MTEDGEAVAAMDVFIGVSEGAHPNVGGFLTTDDGGEASITYTGLIPGTDTIMACIFDPDVEDCVNFGTEEEPITVLDWATKEWTGDPPVLSVTLEPETATNTVGDQHTVTARMFVNGEPAGQLPVRIFVVDGPNAGEVVADFTATDGRLAFSYQGDGGPGTDTVAAAGCTVALLDLRWNGESPFPFDGIGSWVDLCDDAFSATGEDPDVGQAFPECVTLEDPAACLSRIEEVCPADAPLTDQDLDFRCAIATKEWVGPTPAPTVAVLPETGAGPLTSGSDGLSAAIPATAAGIAAIAVGGLWLFRLAYRRR